jgi:hypothetical protein
VVNKRLVLSAVAGIFGVILLIGTIQSMNTPSPEVRRAQLEVNAAANDLVDTCFSALENDDGSLAVCDSDLKSVQAETCETYSEADICKDGRVDQYFQMRQDQTVPISSSDQTTTTLTVSDEVAASVPVEDAPSTTVAESGRDCTSGQICFVSGDFIQYTDYRDGRPWWQSTYSYQGVFDGDVIAVHKDDVDINAQSNYTYPSTLLEVHKNHGISTQDVNYSYYYVLVPSPVQSDRWTVGVSNPDYYDIAEESYSYKGNDRNVFRMTDPYSSYFIVDRETGILLYHERTDPYSGTPLIKRLTDTNIVPPAPGYVEEPIQPPELDLIIDVEQIVHIGDEQRITIRAVDGQSGDVVTGAFASGKVLGPSSSQIFEFGLETGEDGTVQTSITIRPEYEPGTYTVTASAEADGYWNHGLPAATATIAFEVVE